MLAFAPFAFFAATTMRDTGLLNALERGGHEGWELSDLAEEAGLTEYAVSVLVDFGLDLGLVQEKDGRFILDTLGHILLKDEMTRVNMDFTRDFAYQGLPFLEASLREGRPEGLSSHGHWSTLYAGLHELPEPASSSWFRFDHHYSEQAFRDLIEFLFQRAPKHVMDIGANTGRLAHRCLEHDPNLHMTLVDLPGPLQMARRNLEAAGHGDRITLHETDLRESSPLPQGADALVMSQLLACFPPGEIANLLRRAAQAMDDGARLYVIELFPDRQLHEAARFSLNAISLYFTCLVNGTSRFYRRENIVELIQQAGLTIEHEAEHIGVGHTLLCCRAE